MLGGLVLGVSILKRSTTAVDQRRSSSAARRRSSSTPGRPTCASSRATPTCVSVTAESPAGCARPTTDRPPRRRDQDRRGLPDVARPGLRRRHDARAARRASRSSSHDLRRRLGRRDSPRGPDDRERQRRRPGARLRRRRARRRDRLGRHRGDLRRASRSRSRRSSATATSRRPAGRQAHVRRHRDVDVLATSRRGIDVRRRAGGLRPRQRRQRRHLAATLTDGPRRQDPRTEDPGSRSSGVDDGT